MTNQIVQQNQNLLVEKKIYNNSTIRTAYNTQNNTIYVCLIDLERETEIKRDTSKKYIEIFNSKEGYQNLEPRIELEIEDSNNILRPTIFVCQTLANFLIPRGNSEKAIDFSLWLANVATEIQNTGSYIQKKSKKELAYELYMYEVKMEELENQKVKLLEIQNQMSKNCYKSYVNQGTKTGLINKQNEVIEELETKLDESKEYATIKRMEIQNKTKYKWNELKKYSEANNLPMISVFDANYGSVKSYHKNAWLAVYNVKI